MTVNLIYLRVLANPISIVVIISFLLMSRSEKKSCYARVYNPIEVGNIDKTGAEPHDNAVIRACNARYRPNSHLKNDPKSTVFVGRLDKDVTEKDLIKVVHLQCGCNVAHFSNVFSLAVQQTWNIKKRCSCERCCDRILKKVWFC